MELNCFDLYTSKWKKSSEETRAHMLADSVASEISEFSILEQKIVALIEDKNTNKAQKILKKRMESHK